MVQLRPTWGIIFRRTQQVLQQELESKHAAADTSNIVDSGLQAGPITRISSFITLFPIIFSHCTCSFMPGFHIQNFFSRHTCSFHVKDSHSSYIKTTALRSYKLLSGPALNFSSASPECWIVLVHHTGQGLCGSHSICRCNCLNIKQIQGQRSGWIVDSLLDSFQRLYRRIFPAKKGTAFFQDRGLFLKQLHCPFQKTTGGLSAE